ncbi:hypothetical protein [Microseira sp. BLCC-F43]|jgi:hypothetical protein|uniref:hypothetical protein n=1 Tax=Microseira sp. BLCC-F43 TaxID=3153602 RepID=UPI0035B8D9CF
MPPKKPRQATQQDPPPLPAIVALKPKPQPPQPDPPKAVEPIETSSDPETTEQKPEENAFFQAVGIIVGDVAFEGEKAEIAIGGKQYPLFYAPRYKKGFAALKLNIKANTPTQRLLVYPRITHLPGGKPHQVGFQVVGFEGKNGYLRSVGLEDFEFNLCGLWQFIPVCKTPCITVLKNFTEERLAYIKEAKSDRKVAFMKASHIPILWKDAPVKPFRFNPSLDKEQQEQVWFVGVKARFLPGRDVFGFVSLKLPPTAKPPKYLKASKEEKLQVRRAQSQPTKPKEKAP